MDVPHSLDDGQLVVGEQLGAGAQAAVVAAERAGEPRAVKLVTLDKASLRLGGEVAALSAVRHPHVVHVFGSGTSDGWQWIEMERLSGRTFDQAVRADGAFEIPQALALVFELCMGLAALHDRGIVHRDIKPSNVFLSDRPRRLPDGATSPGPAGGRVVVADLGVAQLPAGDVGYATVTGTSLGTVDYAAPEQADDAKRVGPEADQYGVAATLFAIATGARPTFLYAPEEMPHVWENCPEELQPLIRRGSSHEPTDRFEDVRHMARAIAELHEELTGEPCVDAWMEAFDRTTPRPWFFVRWWWAFRRWLR